jgi:Fe-S-cluster-containing dehydrogenase component
VRFQPSTPILVGKAPSLDKPTSCKECLLKCKKVMKKDIFSWSKSFVLEHRRALSKEDKKNFGQEVFRVYNQVRCPCCLSHVCIG